MNKKSSPELSKRSKEREKAYEKFSFFYTQIGFLEGKLLTVVDASYSDREQREAVKSLIKKEVRTWGDWVQSLLVDRETGEPTAGLATGSQPINS